MPDKVLQDPRVPGCRPPALPQPHVQSPAQPLVGPGIPQFNRPATVLRVETCAILPSNFLYCRETHTTFTIFTERKRGARRR